jgi:signal transduction histidine kinase
MHSRFWVLQLLILALALIRLSVTVAFNLDPASQAVEFSTLVIFLIPVVYAALTYGLNGALVTGAWVTLLSVPRFVTAIADHDYGAAWAELVQVVLLDALASLIGYRATAERNARRTAELAQLAHSDAQALYRELFDSNQSPILIVDGKGNVAEASPSAQRAFGRASAAGIGTSASEDQPVPPIRLVDMIGPLGSGQILTKLVSLQHAGSVGSGSLRDNDPMEPIAFEVDGGEVLYRPTATMLGRSEKGTRMQVVFEDVTAETKRHEMMEAFAVHVLSGQEEERRRIAHELHDGPVQTLIHLCRQIDSMSSLLDPSPKQGSELVDLRMTVEDIVAELRSIAKGLRPSILDDLGLVASIDQILSEAGERQDFETSFGVTGAEHRLAPPVELALFRIAQEALSNIERHAAAQQVTVKLEFSEDRLRLVVTDDGAGFDLEEKQGASGSNTLGLAGMTERANLIGAQLLLRSTPGCGTTLEVQGSTTNST